MTAPHVVTPADLPAPYAGLPLRIAYVSNTRHPWCTEVHMGSSLRAMGHSVHYLQEDELDWSTVPALVEAEGIQLLLWTRTWPAEMDVVVPVLEELRKVGVPSAAPHLDRWWGLNREHQVHDQPFFKVDVVFSPDDSPLWAEHGVNHFWLPPGVYGPECEPVPPNPRRWPYDVVFVGSHPYPHPEWAKYRSDLLSAFSKAFRGRFGILPRRGVPIRGRDLQELYATVPVVLGDSCLAGESHLYWSDRVPETLGRGGLLIHPIVDGMEPWYRTKPLDVGPGHDRAHYLGYRLGDFAYAIGLARWALANREASRLTANGGWTLVESRDTYAHRMGTVLAVAEGIHGGYRDVPQWEDRVVAGVVAAGWKPLPAWERASPEVEREAGVSFSAPTPRHSVQLHRWSAIFEPRPGTTDSEVIGEVWRNDYRVPPEGFSGTVVDIGANVGAFSVLAAKAGASQVVAVEPEVGNRERLHHHLRLNGVTAKAMPWAITDGSSSSVVMIGEGGGARSSSGFGDDSVPTVTLAMLLDMIDGPVEFLKMDIEGGEYEAFAACPVEALASVKTIALEFHGPAMPHLSHLDDDGKHLERWGALVAKLADAGRVETFGHPMRGGLIHWRRYGA